MIEIIKIILANEVLMSTALMLGFIIVSVVLIKEQMKGGQDD